jgi:hypothetical protein
VANFILSLICSSVTHDGQSGHFLVSAQTVHFSHVGHLLSWHIGHDVAAEAQIGHFGTVHASHVLQVGHLVSSQTLHVVQVGHLGQSVHLAQSGHFIAAGQT